MASRYKLLLLMLCSFLFGFTGTSPSGRFRVTGAHTPTNLQTGPAEFRLDLFEHGRPAMGWTPVTISRVGGQRAYLDQEGSAVTGGQIVYTDLWMSIHGHGSRPTTTVAQPAGSNHLFVNNAHFVMPGPWEFRVHFGTINSQGAFVPIEAITIPVEVAR